MLAQARKLEQDSKAKHEQETLASAKAAVADRAGTIYENRVEQIARNEEIGKMSGANTIAKGKALVYQRELAKAEHEASQSTETLLTNEKFIKITSQDAAETLGYTNKDSGKMLDYIQEMRQLNVEAAEVDKDNKIGVLVEKVWSTIVNASKNRYGSDSHKHTMDQRRSDDRTPQVFFENPILAAELRQKIFEKTREAFEAYYAPGKKSDEVIKGFDDMRSVGAASVKVLYRDEKTDEQKEVQIWAGNSSQSPYIDEGIRLPELPRDLQITDEQQAVIDEAIRNPDIPIESLKAKLGIKYDEEVLAKIQEDALKDNEIFDQARAKEKRIKEAKSAVWQAEIELKRGEEKPPGYKAVLEYMEYMQNVYRPNETSYYEQQGGAEIKELQQEVRVLQDQLRDEQYKKGIFSVGTKGRQEKINVKLKPLEEEVERRTAAAEQFRQQINTDLQAQNATVHEMYRGDLLNVPAGQGYRYDATRPTQESIASVRQELGRLEEEVKRLTLNLEEKNRALGKVRNG